MLAAAVEEPVDAVASQARGAAAAVFAHVGVVAEPAVLRGRRYGNLVVVGTDDPDLLDDAGLARELRSLPVPARLLTGDELRAFTGRAAPLRDAAPEVEPDPDVDPDPDAGA